MADRVGHRHHGEPERQRDAGKADPRAGKGGGQHGTAATAEDEPEGSQEFGGKLSFSPLGQRGYAGTGKSFPCGHASMGFYWLGLFVFFWERRRSLAWTFGALGLVHGLIMGLGRMAQGGHWASDVLWSAAFVYFTAWGLQRLLPSQRIGKEAHR